MRTTVRPPRPEAAAPSRKQRIRARAVKITLAVGAVVFFGCCLIAIAIPGPGGWAAWRVGLVAFGVYAILSPAVYGSVCAWISDFGER